MQPFAGTDRYEILRPIGAGGMGVVYEALDRERNARVALKTMQRTTGASLSKFKREFRALADVVHPNLVSLYELEVGGASSFFTMELVEGIDFLSWVRRIKRDAVTETAAGTPPLDTPTEATISAKGSAARSAPDESGDGDTGQLDLRRLRAGMRQIAEGVAAVHAAGMLHRDIKPSNVLVAEDGRVVLLDFGLVTELAEEARADDERPLEGTPTYMSPEQGARLRLTPASDWYSVGVLLFVALTGRPPFLGGRDDVLMDKQRFEPPRPSELTPGVPQDLDVLCGELLRTDPERRPPGRDVLRRLGVVESATPELITLTTLSAQSSVDFTVGREAHMDALERAYADAKSGACVLTYLYGRSGMGKSHVLRAFLDSVRERDDTVVLRGRCYERESVPFKGLDNLVDALAQHLASLPRIEAEGLMPRDALALARLFPVLRQVEAVTHHRRRAAEVPDPQELRRRAFSALRELLQRLADRHPLVLAIDDLQWGDVDSAGLLAQLIRPPEPPPLLIVGSYRSEDESSSEFLRVFRETLRGADIDSRGIEVGPLEPEDAHKLAALHLGAGDRASDYATRIIAEAGGSPFFVEQLARHVREVSAAEAETVTLRDVMRARLRRLPDASSRLLATIAVAGRPIAQQLAMRAAGGTEPSSLALLKAGNFVRTRAVHGERYVEPYHDRVREAAVDLLSEDDQRARHAGLAAAFERTPHPDPETLAVHLHGAGDHVRAGEFAAEAAARAAESFAFDRAARLYRMALELLPAAAPNRRDLRVALGHAYANGGRGRDAAEAYLTAVEGATAAERLELRRHAAAQLLRSGHIDDGLTALEGVLTAVNSRLAPTTGRAIASLLWNRARLRLRGIRYKQRDASEVPASQLMHIDVTFAVAEGLGMVDTIRATDFQARGIIMALKAGEPARVGRALGLEAAFSSLNGSASVARTRRVLDAMNEVVEHVDDPHLTGFSLGIEGIAAMNEGRLLDCCEHHAAAERVLREHCAGVRFEIAIAHFYLSLGLALSGQVKAMIDRFPKLVAEAEEVGDLFAATMLMVTLGFYIPLAKNDTETAYAQTEAALARWSPHGFHLQHANAVIANTFVDMYRGDGAKALERIDEAWKPLRQSGMLRVQMLRALFVGLRGRAQVAKAAQTGDLSLLRMAEKAARSLEREHALWCDAAAVNLRANIALLRGNEDEAVRLLDDTIELCEAVDMKLNANGARLQRGKLLGGDEGDELVRTATAYYADESLQMPSRIARVLSPGFPEERE